MGSFTGRCGAVLVSIFVAAIALTGAIAAADAAPPDYVVRFAPELRMDRASRGYPMSAQPFYDALLKHRASGPFALVENRSAASLATGVIPTYFQVRTYSGQTRIHYWWFYGYQHACFAGFGAHAGDWERVMVTLTQDKSAVAAVTFYQHNGSYTRISGPREAACTPADSGRCEGAAGFASHGSHPVVYSGKSAHGSYHDMFASALAGPDACTYYGDSRNPASPADYLQTWRKLIDLDGNEENWIAADRSGNWQWGPGGIQTHPTQSPPSDQAPMCQGSARWGLSSAGCYKSECLAGDEQAAERCVKACKPGSEEAGQTCTNSKLPAAQASYKRFSSANQYRYNFRIPTGDAGLSRARSAAGEWNLP